MRFLHESRAYDVGLCGFQFSFVSILMLDNDLQWESFHCSIFLRIVSSAFWFNMLFGVLN